MRGGSPDLTRSIYIATSSCLTHSALGAVAMETSDKMDSKPKVDMAWPRAQEARDYLMGHKITELLNNMTAQLIYHRPGG